MGMKSFFGKIRLNIPNEKVGKPDKKNSIKHLK